jgi:hypothetical protein
MTPETTTATAKALMKIGRWLIFMSMDGFACLYVADIIVKAKPMLEKMQSDQMQQLQRMPSIVHMEAE